MNKQRLEAIKEYVESDHQIIDLGDLCGIPKKEYKKMVFIIEELGTEVERLQKEISATQKHLETTERHLKDFRNFEFEERTEKERLREALAFYADREQYAEKMEANKGLCMYRPIMRDKGKTARKALEGDNE